ncbi:MAG: cbb3-type cytochrome oxidase assembly protein CcoS [Altererythrobacter sp.]|nr:cbb3-type cytochrome oxidase assembly protein CcoS [Altererythrobacter sp.]
MNALIWLIPIALLLGAAALGAFMWSARSGQFEDLDGAAERIFLDSEDRPLDDSADGAEREPSRRDGL